MSLYNMIMGYNPACVFLLPMLGRRAEDYPRFRDCFLSEDEKHLEIYTRVGGGNRGCGYGEEELYKDENFVRTYDDDYDNTYGTYVFKVPEKWRPDLEKMLTQRWKDVSDEYVEVIKTFYPKLSPTIDELFERSKL